MHVSLLYVLHLYHLRVSLWATGPLMSYALESIAELPDQQVAKMGELSTFWLWLVYYWTLHPPLIILKELKLCRTSQALLCLCTTMVEYDIYVTESSTEHVFW